MEIELPVDLLPQVIRELLSYTDNPDDVQVTDGPNGKLLLVKDSVADEWYNTNLEWRQKADDEEQPPSEEERPEDEEQPVKRKRGRPRKITSATPSEDVL